MSGIDAGVHGLSVDEHRTRPAVAGVAALLDLVVCVFAEQHPKALSRSGFGVERLSVDLESHAPAPNPMSLIPFVADDNSVRISSPSTAETPRRQSAEPSASV